MHQEMIMFKIKIDCDSCYNNGELTFQCCYLGDAYV
jgi:hypothetical protein